MAEEKRYLTEHEIKEQAPELLKKFQQKATIASSEFLWQKLEPKTIPQRREIDPHQSAAFTNKMQFEDYHLAKKLNMLNAEYMNCKTIFQTEFSETTEKDIQKLIEQCKQAANKLIISLPDFITKYKQQAEKCHMSFANIIKEYQQEAQKVNMPFADYLTAIESKSVFQKTNGHPAATFINSVTAEAQKAEQQASLDQTGPAATS